MEPFLRADLDAFASQLGPSSPADDDLSLAESHNVAIVGTGFAAGPLSPYSDAVVPGVPPPIALKSLSETPLDTPSREFQPNFESTKTNLLTPFASVALPTPPTPPSSNHLEKHDLRLPSFELLGIAAPHPDRKLPEPEAYFAATIGAGPLSKPEDPLHDLSPNLAKVRQLDGWPAILPPAERHNRIEHILTQPSMPTVTPPYEATTPFSWPPFPHVRRMAATDTPSRSDSEVLSSGDLSPSTANVFSAFPTTTIIPSASTSWLGAAVKVIVSNIPGSSEDESDSVKVLSHALPCPCTPQVAGGHIFHHIIRAIHEGLPPKTTHWINVFHAVPGRFKLDDLPRSPPSTPGPAIGGDDYFTTKIFDSAVQISDYQGDSKLVASPRPVVVPSSINVSIVERYIPPTNTNEFVEMFSPNSTHSILLDRLSELSSSNGMLLFIYPTKTGGRTFMKEYLGPILDPLLRSMTVTHDLPTDLGLRLGPMLAVDYLLEYSDLYGRLEHLCQFLTHKSSSLQQFQKKAATFSIAHASKEEVVLNRQVWAEHWWVKQEKPRIRDAVTRCFRRARGLHSDSNIIPTDLIQEILMGVGNKRAYPDDQEPKRGVEVGVFVVKKSYS